MPGLRVPDSPANRDLLGYLRTFALPSSKLELDGWELRTHPDLMSWLAELAGSPRALVPVLGIVTIVHKGVIVAAAIGMDTLLFRLPEPPVGVELDEQIRELEPAGWYAVWAWQSTREAADRLGDLLQTARDSVPS